MINYGSIEVQKVPTPIKKGSIKLDPFELAWAAGFFDGEGTTYCSPASGKKLHLYQFQVRVPQAGEYASEVLNRFKTAVGSLGRIYGPYSRGHRKPEYQYSVGKFEHVQAVIAMLWKYLSVQKREQAKLALLAYTDYLRTQALAA